MVQNFGNMDIRPNYSIDNEGNRTFTVREGIGDIEVYDKNFDILVGVTLLKNKNKFMIEIQ